jgi:hypothetical protein
MDVDGPVTNGKGKRKSRSSTSKVNYKATSEDSDSEPQVGREESLADLRGTNLSDIGEACPHQEERRGPGRFGR